MPLLWERVRDALTTLIAEYEDGKHPPMKPGQKASILSSLEDVREDAASCQRLGEILAASKVPAPSASEALTAMNNLVVRMQGHASAYLEPAETYRDTDGAERPKEDKDRAFIADMIYLLDGPEQREAQRLAKTVLERADG